MISKIKIIFLKPDNKKLISNFISLSALQVASFILPLVVIPYLIIVLGIEKFGLVSLAQALMSYFIIFTDYGFSLTATRDIAIYRNNHKKVSSIVNSVFSTKLILGIIGLILFTIILFCVPKFSNDMLLFFYSFSMVIGQLLFPVWFFQGIEQMKYITYLTLTAKLIFTGLVFVLIKVPNDYIYVNILLGMGNIVSSIISIWFIRKKFNVHFKFSSIRRIQYHLKEDWWVLVSNFSGNIYINSNIIILGFFADSIVIGYYSIAEKIMLAIRQLLSVFSQVIYPHICKLTKSEPKLLKAFFKRVFIPFAIFIFICCVLLFVFSDNIVVLITGCNIGNISLLVKLLSIVPIIVCMNIPAYQTLLSYNYKKSYSIVLISGAVISIILNFTLAYYYKSYGTAISIIITELFVTMSLYFVLFYTFKKKLKINLNL